MNNGSPAAPQWSFFRLIVLLACLLPAGCQTQPRYDSETIQRLNRSPAPHVGRGVILHGTTADPVRRENDANGVLGSYLLLDSGGRGVRVLTRRPPPAGIACRVSGLVGQTPGNALLPVVLETGRSRPLRDLLLLLGLLALVIGSVPVAVARLAGSRGSAPGAPAAPRPGADCILELEVVAGPDIGRRHTFRAGRILVGRPGMRHNDLSLEDQTVSRNQAVIIRDEKLGGYKIKNEGRTNPLKLNGRPCDAVALRHGDLLTVGLTTLKVSYREPSSSESSSKRLLVLLPWLLVSLFGASARALPEDSLTLEQLDLGGLPQVTCRFRVTGSNGDDRLGLGPEDFRLLVDGKPPPAPEIRSRLAGGQRPLRLVLVLKISQEDRGRGLFLIKSAVDRLLTQLPESTPVALVSLGQGPRVEQRFTVDRRQLLSRLETIRLDPAVGRGSYYQALELAAGLFPPAETGQAAMIYFCRPGEFTREDMRPESPKGLRVRPEIPIFPVMLPERDGSRTNAYLRRLSLKLTAGFTGHYTLMYTSPGGEDNRVHSLRIDRISSGGGGSACRYLAVPGMGLKSGELLDAADRRSVFHRLTGLLLGLLAGGLAFRWIVGARVLAGRRPLLWLRLHFLLAGAVAGLLVSLLIDRVF